jgi:nucleoid-associated protein YgaU
MGQLFEAASRTQDVEKAIDDTGKALAGEFVSKVEETLVGFFDVMDFIDVRLNKDKAFKRFNDATERYNSLITEQKGIITDIAEAQKEVDRLRERDAERTAQEQLRIRDLTRERDALQKAVDEGQDASLELAAAEEILADAITEADEPTNELIEAERVLLELRERQAELPGLIANALNSQKDAVLGLSRAEADLYSLNEDLPNLTAQQIAFFMSIATSAGIAEASVRSLFTFLNANGQGGSGGSTGSNSYMVKAGDTLAGIAAQLGVSWQDLYNKNKGVIGSDPNKISPGMVLGYAKGGFLPVGGMGVVGERGMELIRATQSGVQVTPLENSSTGGIGNANVTVNVTGFPTDPIVARNIAQKIREELKNLEEEGRGGLLSR